MLNPGDRKVPVLVTYVTDGDSLRVRVLERGNRPAAEETRVRLYGIDAPEIGQRYSGRSRSYLAERAQGRLYLDVLDIDHYGRVVAVAYRRRVKDSLNLAMVRDGWARYAPQYDRGGYGGQRLGLARAENRAASRRRGIWQDRDYNLAPWDYRRLRRLGHSAPERAGRRTRRWRLLRGGCLFWLVALLATLGVLLWGDELFQLVQWLMMRWGGGG